MRQNVVESKRRPKSRSNGKRHGSKVNGELTGNHETVADALGAAVAAIASENAGSKNQLEQLNSYLQIALNNMSRGLSMFDADQRLILCNGPYREIYNLPEELTVPGTPFADILRFHVKRETGRDSEEEAANQRKWIDQHVAELARGDAVSSTQHLGDGRTILISYQPLPGGGWVDLQEDVTEKRQAEEKIAWLARHDTLTEIPNRFHFREQLEKLLKTNSGIVVYWLDLDRFKDVNDTFGHPVGDALLKSVAKRLVSAIRKNDFAARLGGDEFAVIQANVTRKAQADRLAKRLIHEISEPHYVLGQKITVGASVGIAMAPDHGENVDELLRNADLALYSAKSSGRGVHAFFQPEHEYRIEERYELEKDLKSAVKKGQLELHYQPIVDLKRQEVRSLEALMRWHHPKRGMISPADFIPLAEETGVIIEMGEWALYQACADASTWPKRMQVTVNISALQFERGDLYRATVAALERSGLPANRLELEITETVLLRDDPNTHEILHNLRALGVSIALDDFGTSFASLSYLRSFPFDKIKIDRSFVRELPHREDCIAIIEAVAALARKLSMTTVAEGVETIDHLNTVTNAGCDHVQGFYFSRPVPAAEVKAILSGCRSKLSGAA